MMYQDLIKDTSKSPEDIFFELANSKTVSYRTNSGHQVIVEQNSNIDNSTGGIVWETAFLLATYLENNISLKSTNSKILEVGSGCGLLGIALAYEGGNVICTETENTMSTLELNVKKNKKIIKKNINKNNGKLKCQMLRWDFPIDRDNFIKEEASPFNIIVGTDIFFDKLLVKPLLETISALSTSTTEVYLCFQERCADAHAEFLKISSEYFSIVENRSEELCDTKGCEVAKPLDCFLFYLSGVISSKKKKKKKNNEDIDLLNEEDVVKTSKKMKKDKKDKIKATGNLSSIPVSTTCSTTSTSTSSWFKTAFDHASSRAEPDVSLNVQNEGDDDFNGTAVASIAKSWSEGLTSDKDQNTETKNKRLKVS